MDAGYQVLGIDISPAMIEIARRRAPAADVRVSSLFDAEIPPCVAVTALGECVSYLFDPANEGPALGRLARRVHAALAPGGLFVFDLLEPGQVKPGEMAKGFTEGDGWAVLVEKREDRETKTLERRIVTFRRTSDEATYRRSEEIHRVRLYEATEVVGELRRAGFIVRMLRSYGDYRLRPGHAAFVARKGR